MQLYEIAQDPARRVVLGEGEVDEMQAQVLEGLSARRRMWWLNEENHNFGCRKYMGNCIRPAVEKAGECDIMWCVAPREFLV